MTFMQFEKLWCSKRLLERSKEKPNVDIINKINSSLENFFHNQYQSPSLYTTHYLNNDMPINNTELLDDIDSIIAVIDGMIASHPQSNVIVEILELIDEGKKLNYDYEDNQRFISKVYYKFYNKIKFEKSIENVARKSIKSDIDMDFIMKEANKIDKVVVEGVIYLLLEFADELLQGKKVQNVNQKNPQVVINNNNTANALAYNNVSIDISTIIDLAKQQIDDEGFSDKQHEELLEKLSELELIAKSNESKGKRWNKAKEILKWLIEQGIAAASIIVPVLASSIK